MRRTSSFTDPWVRDELTSAELYDPATDSWSNLPAMPVELNQPIATASDQAIYISKGLSSSEFTILQFSPD